MKSRVIRGICLLVCAALVCVCANIMAFTIDTKEMRDNTWQGCLMFGEQQSQPQNVGGFLSSQLDNFTCVLILKTAGYVGEESLLDQAFGGYRVDMPAAPGQSAWYAYCSYEFGELAPAGSRLSYSRYWHGYTLPLRALLCVLDAANIQMLLYFVQMVLMCLVLHLLGRRGLGRLVPGFFLSYFLLMPFSSSICLQYMPVSMLMLIACVCVLKWDARIGQAVTLPAFFALLGLLTNYFDLLTFPLVSLGFPLIMLLALRAQQGESGRGLFVMTALCGCAWALGYGGMWAFKWILNGFVFGWDVLGGIVTQVGLRASDNGGQLSRIGVLMQNLGIILAKKSYLLLIGAGVLAVLAPAAKALVRGQGICVDLRALNMLLPALAVFLWYIVMANHSYDHTYFTYRNMTVAVFSGFACMTCLLNPKKR